MVHPQKKIRIAILDLYAGQINQGMPCIREIIRQFDSSHGVSLETDVFDVRLKKQVPDLSYHLYISSGGPGSPLDSKGSEWEKAYFGWLSQVEEFNRSAGPETAKRVFFICHSFELACRYFKIAKVCKRKSTAFGVFPAHILPEGYDEPVFEGLDNPFFVLESRSYQVVSPNHEKIEEMGASVLALEKERPHVPLERAVIAIRFNEYMIGTQFHPEANAAETSRFLRRRDKKKAVVEQHGEEKWEKMIELLDDPEKIKATYSHILPNFLEQSIEQLLQSRP